jgi:ubiquinone/menaquinone biosynthesis C-methylase UbiE
MIKAKPYQVLPLIYSHLMKRIRYDKWAEYLFAIVKEDCPKKSKVLELAAGDGSFAKYFNKYYPSLIITDISPWMLKNNHIKNKVCCNMLYLPFKSKFDLIYSNFDSVNYILSAKSLLILFNGVSRLLNDNGIFVFDASLEKNSYVHVEKHNREGHYKGVAYKQSSTFNANTGIHINKFRIKFANGDEYSEIHKEKIYPFNTYFKLLDKTNLYVVDCFEAFTFNPGNKNSNRLLFIVKKSINAEI